MASPYEWHTSGVLAFPVTSARLMVFHVQRYRRPEEGRETGEILLQSFTDEAHAQGVADSLNADPNRARSSRPTYL